MSPNKLGTNKSAFFFKICKARFDYLIDEFNFSLKSARKDGNLYEIIFQNKTTAVVINWERTENWIYIELYRLITGKLVRDPINISAETELNGYYLDDLLSIRYPSFSPIRFPIKDKDIVDVMANYSIVLRQYAADVLKGDFTIFNELEKIVKDRTASRN